MKDAWTPFGGGARGTFPPCASWTLTNDPTVCIGLHLAQMELRIATAKFFLAYPNAKVSTLQGFTDEEMDQVIYFLMYPKNKRCLIQGS